MKTLTLKLPQALLAEITAEAHARNISKSEIVRERLLRKSDGNTPGMPASLWNRMDDLVISTDTLPRNLSVSKAHLKGYGTHRSDR